jgi:hypothetical protein
MSYNIQLTDNFKKEAKKLIKKYPSLKKEIESLGIRLIEKPNLGTHLGDGIYKIRIAIASKGKGKSGGARIISYAKIANNTAYLLSIYNKGENATISNQKIIELATMFMVD